MAQSDAHVFKSDLDGSNVTTVATYADPATTFDGYGGITADATHVYWASQHSGVFKAAFSDAPCVEGSTCASPVTIGGASSPFGVAVDDNFVYWTALTGVHKAPKSGGASSTIAINQDVPRGIAVMNGHVYWANTGNSLPSGGSIRRAPPSAAACDGDDCELVAKVEKPDALVAAETSSTGRTTSALAASTVWRSSDLSRADSRSNHGTIWSRARPDPGLAGPTDARAWRPSRAVRGRAQPVPLTSRSAVWYAFVVLRFEEALFAHPSPSARRRCPPRTWRSKTSTGRVLAEDVVSAVDLPGLRPQRDGRLRPPALTSTSSS